MNSTNYNNLNDIKLTNLNLNISENILVNLKRNGIQTVEQLIKNFDNNSIFIKNISTNQLESIKEIIKHLSSDIDVSKKEFIRYNSNIESVGVIELIRHLYFNIELVGVIELIRHLYLNEPLTIESYLYETLNNDQNETKITLRRMGFTKEEIGMLEKMISKKEIKNQTYLNFFEDGIIFFRDSKNDIRVHDSNNKLKAKLHSFITENNINLHESIMKILRKTPANNLKTIKTDLHNLGFNEKEYLKITNMIHTKKLYNKTYLEVLHIFIKDIQMRETKMINFINKLQIYINYSKNKTEDISPENTIIKK